MIKTYLLLSVIAAAVLVQGAAAYPASRSTTAAGSNLLLGIWGDITSFFARLISIFIGSGNSSNTLSTSSTPTSTAANTSVPGTICSLPMIPVGCTWVSTANATAPCAGHVYCPSNSTTIPATNSSYNTTNSSSAWPQYPIKVIAINASNTTVGSGVTFAVTLENTGSGPITYEGGCVSPISLNVTPSSAITFKPEYECMAIALLTLQPNATVTLRAPVGSIAAISQAGPATVYFTFRWSNSTTAFSDTFNFT